MKSKTRQVTIYFDTLPYSELNPNNLRRSHWGKRSEVSKIARTQARLLGRDLGIVKPMEYIELDYLFILPDKRSRDIDNLLGACKAWQDGLVDAGIIKSDNCWHLKKLSGGVRYEKGNEGTELKITEVKS